MDRIGAIKEAMRLENRSVATFAPVPFWRKYRKHFAFLGLLLLVVFSISNASATSYLPFCDSWATVVWTYGPNTQAQATAGGVSGVPYCLGVDGFKAQPSFIAIDSTALSWISANQPAIKNLVESQIAEFDPVAGGAFWAFGFAGVMILYFTSHTIGLVLKAVKNG